MIIITPVDKEHNLFLVENVYSEELIAKILALDLMSYPHTKVDWQEHMPRRRLHWDNQDILAELNRETTKNLSLISSSIGVVVNESDTNVWLDHDQFSMGIHEDNPAVDISMQVYLLPNDRGIGTKFYHAPNERSLRHDFPYTVNTGYIMINAPGQFHGATKSAPAGTLRCSSYTYLTRA